MAKKDKKPEPVEAPKPPLPKPYGTERVAPVREFTVAVTVLLPFDDVAAKQDAMNGLFRQGIVRGVDLSGETSGYPYPYPIVAVKPVD